MDRDDALKKLSVICLNNAQELIKSLQFCAANKIGCFRINSQILPIKTHAEFGYDIYDIPDGENIVRLLEECRQFSKENNIRTSFHPDQFVVMNSPNPDVVDRSIAELEYQAQVAEWVGADVVNIHGGGGYGDKPKALSKFAQNLDRLSSRVRKRLTLENDDTTYTPSDLLTLCQTENIPLVYDIHHHRCNQDKMAVEEATSKAMKGGWFHTGDLAVMHQDGYVKIQDRSKDIIISGGENISSIEIENTLSKHPSVSIAAVVAKPDEKWGEVPCAFIESVKDKTVTEKELIDFCKETLAKFKVPKKIEFCELPKTSTGKIQKFELRKKAKEIN